MKKRLLAGLLITTVVATLFTGCGKQYDDYSMDGGNGNGTVEAPTTTGDSDVTDAPNTVREPEINIKPAESATIQWEDYTTYDGYFNLRIPRGWEVVVNPGDILGYNVAVYDPSQPARVFSFYATISAYKSWDALNMANNYNYMGADLSKVPINPGVNTQSLFENSGHAFDYDNFEVIENLGENGWGGDVLQATCTYYGTQCEGIFTGASSPFMSGDLMPTIEEGTTIMMAPAEEFTSWEPVLVEIFSSLTMTEAYQQARAQAWAQILQTSAQLSQVASYTSDLIMEGWESRNNTYDIMSQEYSDATMGRDRVYDVETGDVYYTDLGWSDSYSGSRYVPVESGSEYYNLPVSGTIY